MKAYHFLKADFTAGEGNEKPWEIGETRTIANANDVRLCEYGYHSSPTLLGALQYAPGPMACLVEVSEPLFKDTDKQVSVSRKLIRAINIERQLRLFGCDCAERVLYIWEKHSNDERPRQAITIARAYANGKATDEQLAAAWDADWAAAEAAEVKWQLEHWKEMFGNIFKEKSKGKKE